MLTAGIVTEFNPFHRGHKYLIDKVREEIRPDLLIVCMSGNFVQRGEPALFDMGARTEDALKNGVDLVFELPPEVSTSSAEGFALGAVSVFKHLGTDILCFGSESGDIKEFELINSVISEGKDEFDSVLRTGLQKGLSYPAAGEAATAALLKGKLKKNRADLHNFLQNPNNILGLEYIKAIHALGSNLKAHTVKRINSSYHDPGDGETFFSAESIRNSISSGSIYENALNDLSERMISLLETYGPVFRDSLTTPLLFALQSEDLEERLVRLSFPEDLMNRVLKNRDHTGSFSGFCTLLKRKNITYTAVSRHLLHLILNISPYDKKPPKYVRLLGFRKDAKKHLNSLKKRSDLKILTNSSDIKSFLSEDPGDTSLSSHLRIDRCYELLRSEEKRREHPLPPEIARKIIIV